MTRPRRVPLGYGLVALAMALGLQGRAALANPDDAIAGQPSEWQMGFQDAVTPVMEKISAFSSMLNFVIIGITLFVMLLMAIVIVRYNARRNPVPSQVSHNTTLEVVWTLVPALIVLVIMSISIPLISLQARPPADEPPLLTLKVTGYQWYWGYEYQNEAAPVADAPDFEGIGFESRMLSESDAAAAGKPRLLGTDAPIVLPVNRVVRVQVTAGDVLHSWTVPSFGIKRDAVPGRLNEGWIKITRPGTYFGQCSELCGKDHAFMPIEVVAVEEPVFMAWTACMKESSSDSAACAEQHLPKPGTAG